MTHAKFLFCVIVTIASALANGFEAMPATAPFSGFIQVLYTPNFEAICTSEISEKNSDEQFGDKKASIVNYFVKEFSPSDIRLSMNVDVDNKSVSMIIPVKNDRKGLVIDELDFRIFPLTDKENESLQKGKKIITPIIEKLIGPGFNNPFHVGSDRLFPDICSLLPKGETVTKSGSFTVIGTAFIRGRESIIFGGEQSMTCTLDEKQFSIKIKGWEAIDRQSGLPSDSSTSSEGSVGGSSDSFITTLENRVCTFTGASTYQPTPVSSVKTEFKSIEQRLVELKALLDKQLISQEQYQKKSTEIIDSL